DVSGTEDRKQLADRGGGAAVVNHHADLPPAASGVGTSLDGALGDLGGVDGAAQRLEAVLADETAGLADFDAEHKSGIGEYAAGGELGLEVDQVARFAV